MTADATHRVFLDELHLLLADDSRTDIGSPMLSAIFAIGAKRNIGLVVSNQLVHTLPEQILGNISCRIVMGLTHPKCLFAAQRSLGLSAGQAAKLAELGPREVMVHYGGHPTPFLCRIDELSFAEPPSGSELDKAAQDFLDTVTWTEAETPADVAGSAPSPQHYDGLTADAVRVFLRLAEGPPETTQDRCDALGMDRAQELRARQQLEAKGRIEQVGVTLGKLRFYTVTAKGRAWAKNQQIKVRRYPYKSGPLHEYQLREVERAVGALDPSYRLQRHSDIAREHGLQPDSLLLMPGGRRAIIEMCCTDVPHVARNLLKEQKVPGVDLVLAVTPNRRLRAALSRAVDRSRPAGQPVGAPLVILDAGTCLAHDFDWRSVLGLDGAGEGSDGRA